MMPETIQRLAIDPTPTGEAGLDEKENQTRDPSDPGEDNGQNRHLAQHIFQARKRAAKYKVSAPLARSGEIEARTYEGGQNEGKERLHAEEQQKEAAIDFKERPAALARGS